MKDSRNRFLVRDWLEYAFLRLMAMFLFLLPRQLKMGIAGLFGIFAFDIVRVRRWLVLSNLQKAFPEKTLAERRRIGQASFINLSIVVMEILRAYFLDRKKILSTVYLDRESEALYHRIIKEGKGVVFVSGHYSNWELLFAHTASLGCPTISIMQNLHNPLINKPLKEIRRKLGVNLVDQGVAVRRVIKTLKKGGVVMLLADQDAGPKHGVSTNFFEKLAFTYRGPATFSVQYNSPLLAMWIYRKGGCYIVDYERLDVRALANLPAEADEEIRIQRLTQAYVKWLEGRIRMDPKQYLWLHSRWETRYELHTK